MSIASTDTHLARPTITISIPPAQRAAFCAALARLKEVEDAPFMSVSAVVVKTILAAAAELPPSRKVAQQA